MGKDRAAPDDTKELIAPKAWQDSLNRSIAQLAAGLTVDGTNVWRRLDESIARLEAKDAITKAR
jgi:hypothetical protein